MHRMTHAPLPEWGAIAKTVTQENVTDSLLAEPWIQNDERGFWFSRSAWSLFAVAQFRKRVTGSANVRVWFPDCFCNASIAPLRDLGVKIDFYPLSVDGGPDMAQCDSMLEGGRPDIIILVHYFGVPTPASELAQFAQDNGAWLVEDAAHILRPAEGIGQSGDFILYSPHKFLPVPDGALLVVQRNSSKFITDELLGKYDFEGLYRSYAGSSLLSVKAEYKWLAKRLLQKIGVRSNRFQSAGFLVDDLIMRADKFIPPRMTPMAKKLLFGMVNSFGAEERIRSYNRDEWCKVLAKNQVTSEGMAPLKVNGAPYLAGFSCDNAGIAEKNYNLLIKAKIPVTTWPDLPPEVRKDPARYKVTISMRATRIFFPVHRSICSSGIQNALRFI